MLKHFLNIFQIVRELRQCSSGTRQPRRLALLPCVLYTSCSSLWPLQAGKREVPVPALPPRKFAVHAECGTAAGSRPPAAGGSAPRQSVAGRAACENAISPQRGTTHWQSQNHTGQVRLGGMASPALDVSSAVNRGWNFFRSIGSPRFHVAPMVLQSELAFRMLCRKYGAQSAYALHIHWHSYK